MLNDKVVQLMRTAFIKQCQNKLLAKMYRCFKFQEVDLITCLMLKWVLHNLITLISSRVK